MEVEGLFLEDHKLKCIKPKELELSSIENSLSDANKVVDDGELVLQFIVNGTLKRCKKVKK